jgi:hypothetical protein
VTIRTCLLRLRVPDRETSLSRYEVQLPGASPIFRKLAEAPAYKRQNDIDGKFCKQLTQNKVIKWQVELKYDRVRQGHAMASSIHLWYWRRNSCFATAGVAIRGLRALGWFVTFVTKDLHNLYRPVERFSP